MQPTSLIFILSNLPTKHNRYVAFNLAASTGTRCRQSVVGRSAPPLSTVTPSQTKTGIIIQSFSSTVNKAASSSTIVAKASSAAKPASSASVANQSPSQCRAGSWILSGRTCTVICGQDRQGGDYDRTQTNSLDLCAQNVPPCHNVSPHSIMI